MVNRMLIIEERSDVISQFEYSFSPYFIVDSCSNGLEGLVKAIESMPEVIVINEKLPNLSSVELCKEIRKKLDSIIIIIGDHMSESTAIKFFEAGADDVNQNLTSYSLLFYKVKVLLEKLTFIRNGNEIQETKKFGSLFMDKLNFKVYYENREINFTKKEFAILWVLVTRGESVVTRHELLKVVWSYESLDDDRLIDTHLNRIRKKLKHYHVNLTIETVWGIGYKLQSLPDPKENLSIS